MTGCVTMSQGDASLQDVVEELQKNNQDTVQRRSVVNPIYWIGLALWLTGILFGITIVGLPVAVVLIRASKPFMYKNYEKQNGL